MFYHVLTFSTSRGLSSAGLARRSQTLARDFQIKAFLGHTRTRAQNILFDPSLLVAKSRQICYSGQLWTMSQLAGIRDPDASELVHIVQTSLVFQLLLHLFSTFPLLRWSV